MSSKTYVAVLALLVSALSACATLPGQAPCVSFGPGAGLCLLAPTELPAVDTVHVISFKQDEDEQSFIGQTHVDAQGLHLVTSSLLGPTIFSVSYDGHTIETQPADGPWHADLLLASVEMALASKEALTPALHGLTLQQTDTADGYRRDILRGQELMAHIEVSGPQTARSIRLDFPPAHISVSLRPLPAAPP